VDNTLTRTTADRSDPNHSGRVVPTVRVIFYDNRVVDDPALPIRNSLSLGRAPEQPGLTLAADARISRAHACIQVERTGCTVRDLDSHNGTWVNGHPVTQPQALHDGDIIRCGDSLLVFRQQPLTDPLEECQGSSALFGRSRSMCQLRREIAQVAPTGATVLLLGETGTGKGVAAREIHRLSKSTGPFVSVNCAAVPEALAESAFFGHETGAFTGATRRAEGYFRSANGGTLFIDEIGEPPISVQAKLLHAVEERQVVPVGATRPVTCEVRLVAATIVDLRDAMAAGRFRGDLYARIAEFVVRLPPLRERREDILPLLVRSLDTTAPPLSPDLAELLLLHSWPFNVRELEKVAMSLQIRGQSASRLDPWMVAERIDPLTGQLADRDPSLGRAAVSPPPPAVSAGRPSPGRSHPSGRAAPPQGGRDRGRAGVQAFLQAGLSLAATPRNRPGQLSQALTAHLSVHARFRLRCFRFRLVEVRTASRSR